MKSVYKNNSNELKKINTIKHIFSFIDVVWQYDNREMNHMIRLRMQNE